MIFTGELNYFVRLETGLSINYKFHLGAAKYCENKVVYIKIIWSQLTTYLQLCCTYQYLGRRHAVAAVGRRHDVVAGDDGAAAEMPVLVVLQLSCVNI